MAAYYLDSSAVVKRYIRETGTGWLLGLVDPASGNDLFLARITGVEVTSAIVRRERAGTLSGATARGALAQFRHDFTNQYQMIEISDIVVARAMAHAETHDLRAYDALQLAAASEIHAVRTGLGLPPLTVISADDDLNAAATNEGLTVQNPNDYP